jgi:hypothetical protein
LFSLTNNVVYVAPLLTNGLGIDNNLRTTTKAIISKRIEASMDLWHAIVLDGEVDDAKYKKGAPPTIEVKIDSRKGSKSVTV